MEEKPAAQTDVEIDVGALLSSLIRKLPYIIVFVGLVAVGTYLILSHVAPVYKAEATVIIETSDSDPTRPDTQNAQPVALPDQQAVASEIQLIQSRDIAEQVADKLDLRSRPEFDPTLAPPSFLGSVLARFGLGAPVGGTADDRVLVSYFKKLDVYAVDQSRVIAIDFSSTDPKLAADAANAIADGYLAAQAAAKRDTTSTAADFLGNQIDDLRGKVVAAESKVEAFRAQNDLFTNGGQTPTTLPDQQLADLNAELDKARADHANAGAEADQIRAALQAGAPVNLPDVVNSPLVQGLVQQEVALKAQVAQLSATLLPQHPRMKELNAQLADLEKQIAAATQKIVDSLDANAQLAAARESAIDAQLTDLKAAAAKAGDAGVQLAELDREASADRDLLDQYLRSYREAVAQTDYLPPDARIVSHASSPLDPDFPKKAPMTAAASVAAAILAIAIVLLSELASGRPMRRLSMADPLPITRRRALAEVRVAAPAIDHEPGLRPALAGTAEPILGPEPTLAPALAGRIEHSLQAIAARLEAGDVKQVIVTLAEGSDIGGRPLAALALARAIAGQGSRVALVDFSGDQANARAVGEGGGLPGLSDVFDGTASFSDVLFRDARSRVHFVPGGSRLLAPAEFVDDRIATILSALTLTYDCVVLDARQDVVARLAPTAGAAMVVSRETADDPRTERALASIRAVSAAELNLLVIDATADQDGLERAAKDAAMA